MRRDTSEGIKGVGMRTKGDAGFLAFTNFSYFLFSSTTRIWMVSPLYCFASPLYPLHSSLIE